jgi:hypothetical protein
LLVFAKLVYNQKLNIFKNCRNDNICTDPGGQLITNPQRWFGDCENNFSAVQKFAEPSAKTENDENVN